MKMLNILVNLAFVAYLLTKLEEHKKATRHELYQVWDTIEEVKGNE